MTSLSQQINNDTNIDPSGQILLYTNATDAEVVILCEIELGNDADPIVGGGVYSVRAAIDDVEIIPDSQVIARSGQTKVVIQSRHLVLAAGATIKLLALGRTGDVDVYSRVTIYDVTPLRNTDLFGTGTVVVDHNYGGADTLRIATAAGVGIQDAEIRAYLATDYDNNQRNPTTVRGKTNTDVNGRWRSVLMLAIGTYKLLISKPSQIQTKVITLEVTE